jgi:hypothetical protein
VGDAWAVASAICFAAQMFLAERAMQKLPKGSELPLMAVSMLTVAALASGAAAAVHAGDLPAAADGVRQLLSDWQAALPAALGGGAAVPAAEAEEAARTAQQLFYTAVVSTDLVLFVELMALQVGGRPGRPGHRGCRAGTRSGPLVGRADLELGGTCARASGALACFDLSAARAPEAAAAPSA